MKRRNLITTVQILLFLLACGLWQAAVFFFPHVKFVAGSPFSIAMELKDLILHGGFFYHMWITAKEAILGLIIGTLIGTSVGLALWSSVSAAKIFHPFIVILSAVPVFAFAPLLIVWFGIGIKMKIALAAISTLAIAITQSYKGAMLISKSYFDFLEALAVPKWKIFINVVAPGSIDWIFASIRLNIGFALLGAFIGEFIASDCGLGHVILRASSLYDIPRAFAASIGIVFLAAVLNYVGFQLEKKRHQIIQIFTVPYVLWKPRG